MRTILWFIYFWLYLLFLMPKARRIGAAIAQGRKDDVAGELDRIVKKWANDLMKAAGVKVEVTGLENIPQEAALFVGNHQGNFDIPIALTCLGPLKSMVAKRELQKLPFLHTWMEFFDCIFIDRGQPRKSLQALTTAQKQLSEGGSVVIFPEGTRSKCGVMNEFKPGAVRCAVKAQVPIVPFVIDGSYKAMEAHGFWIHPAAVKVTILPPVPTKELKKESTKDISETIQSMIAAHLKGNEQWMKN